MKNLDKILSDSFRDQQQKEDEKKFVDTLCSQAGNLSQEEREDQAIAIKQQIAANPPTNARELHTMVRVLYGIDIPTASTHPEYNAPFEYFAKIWFSKVTNAVALASRGGGKTFIASIFADSTAAAFPKMAIVHAGGTKTQAQVASKYLENFHQQPVLKDRFTSEPAAFSAKYKNKSRFDIVTGSMKGVSGQHPVILTLDEIEFWDIEALVQTFEVPVDRGGYKRRWLAYSTRQRCLPFDCEVLTEDGLMYIGDIVNQKYAGKALSFNFDTCEWEWKSITRWYRNGASKQWYRLYSGNKCVLVATGDHHVYMGNGVKVAVRDLYIHDKLCSYDETGELSSIVIDRIDIVTDCESDCFDIGVEDNHNYLTGNNILVSNSYGAMAWLVDEAPKRGFELFQWTIFELMRPCINCEAIDTEPHGTDEARTAICPLYPACKGERARKSAGWVTLQQARDKCIRLGGPFAREWQTQGLCSRPSSHGLVLHNFEKTNKPEGNYTQWQYVPELPWYATHDPAEGKKSVILFLQRYEGNLYLFDELVDAQCADVTQAKQAFWEHCQKMGYGDPQIICVDPHRTDAVATWRHGTSTGEGIMHRYNADVPDISQKTGTGQLIVSTLEILRRYICDGSNQRHLFINPQFCPCLDRAIGEYHYPTDNITNAITSDNPDKAYSDEIDPLRYWCMYEETKLRYGGSRALILGSK